MTARTMLVWVIAFVPSSRLRRWFYGMLPGYSIHPSSRIGWRSVVDVQRASMDAGSSVGRGCRIVGSMHFELDAGATLGARNRVECGQWYAGLDSEETPYEREFVLGQDVTVTTDHYFDALGGIRIGEGSVIAGLGSQFWTHGLGAVDRSVSVGRYTYVGSAVRFAPGARVGDLSVVALASVVTSDLSSQDQVLVAGVPAAVVREGYRPAAWDALKRALDEGRVAYKSPAT